MRLNHKISMSTFPEGGLLTVLAVSGCRASAKDMAFSSKNENADQLKPSLVLIFDVLQVNSV